MKAATARVSGRRQGEAPCKSKPHSAYARARKQEKDRTHLKNWYKAYEARLDVFSSGRNVHSYAGMNDLLACCFPHN